MNEFNYYFNGVRYTSVDVDFLNELAKDCEDQQGVIDGILESNELFNESIGDN